MSNGSVQANFFKSAYDRIDITSIRTPFALSLLNQIVTSGGNFLVGIYLARTLSLENFGLYGIGYGICMLYVGAGNAVLITQMVVNMPDREPEEKEKYAARILCAVLLLGIASLLLTAAVAAAAASIDHHIVRHLPVIFAIATAAALFLCNEFFVSYAYMKRRESLALVVNVATMTVLFAGLAVGKLAGLPLSAEETLLLYAFGATVGSTIAYFTSSLAMRGNLAKLGADFREAWSHGRWALGGVIVTWIQTQTYTYALAFFLGPAGVGQANAARIFISPFSFLVPAVNKVAIPRLADLRRNNRKKMYVVSWLLTAGLTLLAVLYSLILLSSLDWVVHTLLGRSDRGIEALVWIWCLVLVIQMFRSGGGILLQIQRKFRMLLIVNIPSAVVTILAAVLLILWLGAVGAIWGMVAGEAILAFLIWKEIWHGRANDS